MTQQTSHESDASSQSARPGLYRWYVLIVLTAAYALVHLDGNLPFILIEEIKADLGISDTMIGIITGPAFALVYAVSAIPVATLADRYSRKHIIGFGIILWSGFTAAGGLAGNGITLMLSRIGVACSESVCTPASHSIIGNYFGEHERAKAIAIYSLGLVIGGASAIFIGGLLAKYYGWRSAMFLVGIAGMLLSALVIFTVREPLRTAFGSPEPSVGGVASEDSLIDMAPGPKANSYREMLSDRRILHILLGGGFLCISFGAGSSWTAAYTIRHFDLDVATVGMSIGSIGAVVGVIGILIGGFVGDYLSRKTPGKSFQFLAGALVVLLVVRLMSLNTDSFHLFLFLIGTATLIGMCYVAPTYSTPQSFVEPTARSRMAALLVLTLNGFGIAMGAFMSGVMSDLLNPRFGEDALRISLNIMVAVPVSLSIWQYWMASRVIRRAFQDGVHRDAGTDSDAG